LTEVDEKQVAISPFHFSFVGSFFFFYLYVHTMFGSFETYALQDQTTLFLIYHTEERVKIRPFPTPSNYSPFHITNSFSIKL
jgi:hypothetical protein